MSIHLISLVSTIACGSSSSLSVCGVQWHRIALSGWLRGRKMALGRCEDARFARRNVGGVGKQDETFRNEMILVNRCLKSNQLDAVLKVT